MLNALKTALVLTLLGALTAAAQNGPNQPVDVPKPAAADPNHPAAVDTATYEIGAQDLIFVDVWRHEEFTKGHRVRPDGKITIPLVGDVQASGLTPERLGSQLTQALMEYVNQPVVNVSVLEVQSKTYKMAGAISKPGSYPMPVPITIFDAINNAGGFPPNGFAKKKEILVIREGTRDRLVFNYEDYVKGKNMDKNINFFLQNGDTVLVKE
jgi:polysaccharide export outer membrane protein